jgi:isoquinoline 1-oxidoreductase subunit beta
MSDDGCTRRDFARWIIVGGIGLSFAGCGPAPESRPLSPEWWLELHADGAIRMLTKRVEMGQGAHTGLRTLMGEELDVDPQTIAITQVDSDPKYGEIITGGSFTLAGWQDRMRRAGATARAMLVQAAAARWKAPIDEVTTQDGHLIHARTGQREPYRKFVAAAARLPAPPAGSVKLKAPEAWRYIGKPAPIAHHTEIVNGVATYGIDVRVPGMCFAVLARAPVLGARLVRFDDAACHAVRGFIRAVALKGNEWPAVDHCRDAVALVAENSWAAQQAREALRAEWDTSARANIDTPEMYRQLEAACPPLETSRFGAENQQTDDATNIRSADRANSSRPDPAALGARLTATFHQPFLAHAPLEPPNATARVSNGRIEVWSSNQRQTRMKDAIVKALGVTPENVTVHATLIGGSFGRRLEIDYGVEAAKLAAAIDRPVQVLWTREDDLQFGLYRSGSVHRLAASLDERGRLLSFAHAFAADSVLQQQEPDQIAADRSDWTLATPLAAVLYDIPQAHLAHRITQPLAPCAWWRGTYWSNVTIAVECFLDELAQRSGQDPLAFRLAHLQSTQKRELIVDKERKLPFDPTRMRRVLTAAAEQASWQTAAPKANARGLACGIYDSPECHTAVVAEMNLRNGVPTLVSATIAVDVGTVVNPEIVKSQAMGGFLMGASAALKERITWRNGRVEQRGFQDYPLLRMHECPRIEVVLVPSDAGICGVGELVTPAAMAAVTNAASRLLNERIRSWPILTA